MYCRKCGAQVNAGMLFCPKCGAAAMGDPARSDADLSPQAPADSRPDAEEGGAAEVVTDEAVPDAVAEPTAAGTASDKPEPSRFRKLWDKSSKPKKVLIAAAGVIALVFLLVLLEKIWAPLVAVAFVAGLLLSIFTGTKEERRDAKVVFKITGENFVVDRLDINGREQSDLVLYALLSAIYETDQTGGIGYVLSKMREQTAGRRGLLHPVRREADAGNSP